MTDAETKAGEADSAPLPNDGGAVTGGGRKLSVAAIKIVTDFLDGPCPICGGIEGCSDTVCERLRAALSPDPQPHQDEGVGKSDA